MNRVNYTIVFVSDMKRSIEFYRDVLGFTLKFESPGWTEFITEGTTLALHPKGETPAGVCIPGLNVPDLDAFHAKMEANGVRCIRPPRREEFGVRLALYADPDGLPLSVGEAPKKSS
jgi:catechol 2,3-dioxygenase-like lactoylglutathione lyase family enzyme